MANHDPSVIPRPILVKGLGVAYDRHLLSAKHYTFYNCGSSSREAATAMHYNRDNWLRPRKRERESLLCYFEAAKQREERLRRRIWDKAAYVAIMCAACSAAISLKQTIFV